MGPSTVLTPAFAQYARAELGYRTDLEYRLLNREVSGRWDFGTLADPAGFRQRARGAADRRARATRRWAC